MATATDYWRRSKGKGKAPLRSLTEFSREVKVCYGTLSRRMRESKNPPKIMLTSGKNAIRSYNHIELHKWHNSFDNTTLKLEEGDD